MGLAEGTPPADCAEALPSIGQAWGDSSPSHPLGSLSRPPALLTSLHMQETLAYNHSFHVPVIYLLQWLDCMSCMYKGGHLTA